MKNYRLTFLMQGGRDYECMRSVDNISAFVENVRFMDHFHIDENPSHQLLNLKYLIALEVEEMHEWKGEV